MIDSLIKHENLNNVNKINVDNLLNDVYLLPKWEKIKTFSVLGKFFIFQKKALHLNLYRKFSSKNQLEKYSLRTPDEKVIASMDIKVYKDSVYIIDFDINSKINFDIISRKMLQIAVEKALYNTTEKEVVINLTSNALVKHKIKKCLINNEFVQEESQSDYEKDLFGETYILNINNNSKWMKRIKQFSFLINK